MKEATELTQERSGFTFKQTPITLLGPELKAGDKAPDAVLSKSFADDVKLSDFAGKVRLISVTPSLDTGVCDIQARRFNQEAAALGDAVVVINVSVDLPPAQARWCGAAGADNITVLSDYKLNDFGLKFGVLIKEFRVDMRAVFVIDKDDTIRYVEIVPELTQEPDYDRAIEAVKALL